MVFRTLLHRLVDWLYACSIQISSVLLVLLSVIDISNLNEYKISKWGLSEFPIGKIVYVLAVLGSICFGLISYSHAKSLTKLELDNREKGDRIIDLENTLNNSINEMNELFNSYLHLIVNSLELDHTSRISVYKVFEGRFILLGRASSNPKFGKVSRRDYPLDEGFIAKGWEEGSYFIDDLPDPKERGGEPYYRKVAGIKAIDNEVIRSINMKSRTYFVHRINGYDSTPKAILVIESTTQRAFTRDLVMETIVEVEQPLVMFIERNNGVTFKNSNNLGL